MAFRGNSVTSALRDAHRRAIIKLHVLPGEEGGDTACFYRQNAYTGPPEVTQWLGDLRKDNCGNV
jgi:hypothetical protein